MSADPDLVGDRSAQRGARWITAARWAALVTACSVMVSPPVANAGMALMLIFLLASGQALPRLRQACGQPLGIAALFLVAVVALAMLWADVPWRERWVSFWSWRKLWLIPIVLALFGPLAWKRRLLVAYVAVCGVAVLISFGIVAATQQLPTSVFDAAGSLLRNHSAQSMAFATATLAAVWLALEPDLAPRWRTAAAGLAALFVANMAFVTPGRSGLLALVVMLVVLSAFNLRSWRNVALAGTAAALLAVGVALSPVVGNRISEGIAEWNNAAAATQRTSMGVRAVLYENTLELVRERPLLGTGTGGFAPAYEAHVKRKYSDWRVMPTADPHSQYLFFLAEQGAVGLIAFLLYIALALADRGDGSRARIVAAAMLLGWCATSLLSSHFKTFAEGNLLAMFLAAMLARPVPRYGEDREATGAGSLRAYLGTAPASVPARA